MVKLHWLLLLTSLLANNLYGNEEGRLEWSTVRETNTSYFMIEYSIDGINYSPYEIIKAKGYSLSKTNYELELSHDIGQGIFRITLFYMGGEFKIIKVLNLNSIKENRRESSLEKFDPESFLCF